MNVEKLYRSLAGFICSSVLLSAFNLSAQNLFELDSTNINQFTPAGAKSNFAPLPSAGIVSLTIDKYGNLYVGSFSAGLIYVYNSGGTSAGFAQLPTSFPYSMTFDNTGTNLYVGDAGLNGAGHIYKYTPNGMGNTFANGLNIPAGLAFDRAGDLFEADEQTGNIYEFTNYNGTLSPNTNLFASGLNEPTGLAFNSKGVLFVANDITGGSITEITTNGVTSTFVSGLNMPRGLAVDGADNVYEADTGSGNIYKFSSAGQTNLFASGLQPYLLAFQPISSLQAHSSVTGKSVVVTMPSPYYSTVLQASTNFVNWTAIYTNTPPFTFTDSAATAFPNRFYRAFTWQ
jgi:hypothetical protein